MEYIIAALFVALVTAIVTFPIWDYKLVKVEVVTSEREKWSPWPKNIVARATFGPATYRVYSEDGFTWKNADTGEVQFPLSSWHPVGSALHRAMRELKKENAAEPVPGWVSKALEPYTLSQLTNWDENE